MTQHPSQPPPVGPSALDRLDALVADLRAAPAGSAPAELWRAAHQALKKTRADQVRAGRAIAERNVEAVAELARQARAAGDAPPRRPLSHPPPVAGPPPGPAREDQAPAGSAEAPPVPPAPAPPPAEITHDVLKHALAAFKKRLKLTRLDDESRLGVGKRAMTGGRKSAVVAIIPPSQYPRAVWDELASQGKIKRSGSGFYELVE